MAFCSAAIASGTTPRILHVPTKLPTAPQGGWSHWLLSPMQMRTWEGCLWDATQLGIGSMMNYYTSFSHNLTLTPALCLLPLTGLHEQNTSELSAHLLFLEEAMGNQCFLSNKQDPRTWIFTEWTLQGLSPSLYIRSWAKYPSPQQGFLLERSENLTF